MGGQPHCLDTSLVEDLSKCLRVQWIPIEQQVPFAKQKPVECIDEISGHLFHPRATRVHSYSKDFHLPARNIDREQHVVANQSKPRHGFYREEVHADQHAQMGLDEGRPRSRTCVYWQLPLVWLQVRVLPQDQPLRQSGRQAVTIPSQT